MKTHKYGSEPTTQFFIGAAGGIAVTLAATFGWYSEAKTVDSILDVHSVILVAVGVGLLATGIFVRRTVLRVIDLESQVAKLPNQEG
jgi:ammonia channel protein AmtB